MTVRGAPAVHSPVAAPQRGPRVGQGVLLGCSGGDYNSATIMHFRANGPNPIATAATMIGTKLAEGVATEVATELTQSLRSGSARLYRAVKARLQGGAEGRVVGGVVNRPRPQPNHPGSNRKPPATPRPTLVGQQPAEAIDPTLIRQWQNQLASQLGHESEMACRSILFRILQLAEDEGAIASNPVRKVPAPKRRVDPDQVSADTKRRALTPEEAGRLLARFPLFWWDHVLYLLGTGLRFGSSPACACVGPTWIGRSRSCRWWTPATRPAGTGVASSPAQDRRRHPRDPTSSTSGRGDSPSAAARF